MAGQHAVWSLTIPIDELKMMAARLELDDIDWSSFAANGFAEALFAELLGAQSLTSIDYSDYQDVDVVHDLNTPVPTRFHGAFDAEVDGGTMERIFDVKEVLANYMNMVKVGGSLFIMTSTNNLCGHGFYQFIPELFYRLFENANGFEAKEVALWNHHCLA